MYSGGLKLDEELNVYADNQERLGQEAVRQLIAGNTSFDAIFAATDVIAIGAMRALMEHGLAVPDDVSVIGFDDLPLASQVTPALTTVQQNIREASEGLVHSIVSLIRGESVESTLMAPRLILRDSCGGVPDG